MAAKRFDTVPEHWKSENGGPYVEAPAEFGGGWYIRTPFTGPEPWRTQQNQGQVIAAPQDFIDLFGEIPSRNPADGGASRNMWLQRLRHFKGTGVPEWVENLETVNETFIAWGMGKPVFYEGRYGWMAFFKGTLIGDYETWGTVAALNTHNAIASFQMDALSSGKVPEVKHPFVPPNLWPKDDQ